jgi:protein TonB
MNLRLFEALVSSNAEPPRRRGYTLPVSLAVHAIVLSAAAIAPVLSNGDLPEPTTTVKAFFSEPAMVPAPAPPPPPPIGVRRSISNTPPTKTDAFVAPTHVSAHIEPSDTSAPADGAVVDDDFGAGDPDGERNGIKDGLSSGLGDSILGPPPALPTVVRVGGGIEAPKKLNDIRPIYPAIAKQAHVQGTVILECTIDPHGRVQAMKVLHGVPLLDAAAQEAVRQWVYTPTRLNGVPVAVIMTVTVTFHLQ